MKSHDSPHAGGAAFLEHIDGLYSYALVLARNHSDADDLVQETCLRALPAMERLREGSNVRGWLYTILRNIWFNQLRQRRTARQVDSIDIAQRLADIPSNGSQDPYSLLAGKTEREQLRDAIQQLPIESREIIMLREYGELSYQEIADAMDVPVGTVMSRLGRARSKLRTLLLASFESPSPSWGRALIELRCEVLIRAAFIDDGSNSIPSGSVWTLHTDRMISTVLHPGSKRSLKRPSILGLRTAVRTSIDASTDSSVLRRRSIF